MRISARRWGSPLALLLTLPVLGCFGRGLSPPPPDPNPLERETYVIGVRDVLGIRVWKNPELGVNVVVRMDGKISVPLLDDVQAEGLEPMELKEVLAREMAEYIAAPDVTVIVSQMNSRFVSILGDGVRRNMRVPLSLHLRVLEAIAMAGGFTAFADKDNIRIVRRQEDGSEVEFRFNYDAYIKGRAPGTNIVLENNDTILVPD
ncbi:MAG: polysaccharide biosynthesis/export family protein [Planctomycetota bacterium]|jgi:polysaccharide export outer membrane protein